jgi:Flp pilus assembly protein TadB
MSTPILAVTVGLLAVSIWPVRRTAHPALLVQTRSVAVARSDRPRGRAVESRGRWLLAAALAGAIVAASPTAGGAAAAVLVGAAALVVMQCAARGLSRADEARRFRELPTAVDLMCLMIRSGSAPSTAVAGAATAVQGPLSADLTRIAALEHMGAGTADAWRDSLDDPVLGPVAMAAVRSADSGAALEQAWSRVASDVRVAAGVRAETAARRAGVAALAPLGLCFLPAFICLGVVPIVIGLAGDVF